VTRAVTGLAALVLLLGCSAGEDAARAPGESATAPAPAPAAPTPKVADFPALASKDCAAVVTFYLEALGGREWATAALVWNDPAIDGARLQAVYGGYRELQLAWNDPLVEGAAGSSYCTVSGTLTDAQDAAKAPIEGTLLLRRVNDVPGATPDQLRWTLRSSTFVERLERSDGSQP
jgi:hypothetical protein